MSRQTWFGDGFQELNPFDACGKPLKQFLRLARHLHERAAGLFSGQGACGLLDVKRCFDQVDCLYSIHGHHHMLPYPNEALTKRANHRVTENTEKNTEKTIENGHKTRIPSVVFL